jgi:sulfopropanediol 3-dehydrogenase
LIADLPNSNRENAFAAWRDYAEVIVRRSKTWPPVRMNMPEHLTVQAEDPIGG